MDDTAAPPPPVPTGTPPGPPPGPPSGPPPGPAWRRDLDGLHRSRDDRYLAGVAGGLGRHFDVDPTVVRVVLAVLAAFGGAGLLIYLAVWLLVPADGAARAALPLSGDVVKVLLLGTVALAVAIVLGIPWGEQDWAWGLWPTLLVGGLVVWLVTRDRGGSTAAPPPPGAPVIDPGPSPARQPRRTGLVLFWPTLALVAVGLGVVGLVDAGYAVPIATYAATALTLTGLALLLGAFRGRPGGLIALGLVLVVALGATSAADAARSFGPYRDAVETPASAAEAEQTYRPESGDFTLDLRQVGDLATLDQERISVRMDVGELSVVLPRDLNAEVDAAVRYAGEIDVAGDGPAGGLGSRSGSVSVVADPDAPTVYLDLDLGTGQIDVTRDVSAVIPQETR